MLPNERTSFGFKEGISDPDIEGSGIPPTNPAKAPFKAGEFVLGYPNESGDLPPEPQPEVLGRNGSYVVFRKLQTRRGGLPPVRPCPRNESSRGGAAGRQVRRPLAERRAAGARSGARRSGARGRSGAEQRLPLRGGRRSGLKCPLGAHARRTDPRDSKIVGVARFHRIIRRSSSYGPMLS